MEKKILVFGIFMLFSISLSPLTGYVLAGDEDDPEVEDRIRDVTGFVPYSACISIDMVSAWFSEDESNPDYLYVSLKTVDLDAKIKTRNRLIFRFFEMSFQRFFKNIFNLNSKIYQMVYAVEWKIENNYYVVVVHGYTDHIGSFLVGKSTDGDSEMDDYYYCDGVFDKENNIITWEINKDLIDNPSQGSKVEYIGPHTHYREVDDSGKPTMDYAKDIPSNAIVIKDYILQY